MQHTLCGISNSCSNYKIPEGLVINRGDAMSVPEREQTVHGRHSACPNLAVLLKTLHRDDDSSDVHCGPCIPGVM